MLHLAEVRQLCLLSKQWCLLCVNTTTLLSTNTRQMNCFRCLAIALNDSSGIRMRDFPLFRMGKDSFNAQLTGVRGNYLNHVMEFFSTYMCLFTVVVPAVITTAEAETTAGLCCIHVLCRAGKCPT